MRNEELVKAYCVTDLSMSKQQELVEASFQMRCRIFDFSASSFAAIPLELVPLEVDYVEALSHQEVPDYFAGPAMPKTITQETQVVFGPEQEEWKAAILAELQSPSLGWLDPLDVFYQPLGDDLQQLCAGADNVPDYGASTRAWRLKNFGDSTLALELLRLEEHAFYTLILKMTATKAALSPNIFRQSIANWL